MTKFAILTLGFAFGVAAALAPRILTQKADDVPEAADSDKPQLRSESLDTPAKAPSNTLDVHASLAAFDSSAYEQAATKLENEVLRRTVDSLMEFNPSEAASLLLQIPPESRRGLYRAVAIEWARERPEAALAWFNTHGSSLGDRERNAAMDGLWHSYANQDPAAAERRFHEMETGTPPESFYTSLAEGWATSDPGKGLQWLANLDRPGLSPETINDAYVNLARAHISQDLPFAMGLADTLEDPGLRQELLPEIASVLARQDLEAAIDWLSELNADPSAPYALAALTATLPPEDDSLALDIALDFKELFASESSLPTETLALIASRSPELIAQRINEIPSSAHDFLGEQLARHWLRLDSQEASSPSWLSQLPPGPAFDAVIVAKLSSDPSQTATDAIDWATKIGEPTRRIDTLNDVIHSANLSELAELSTQIATSGLSAAEKEKLQKTLSKRMDDATL